MFWYSELYCRVRWDDEYSVWFLIIAGVRQGGILSPIFYAIYVDDLISILSQLKVGCYIYDTFIAALLYADDMALLSPSLKGLQLLLSACEQYCKDWDICLNSKKTKNIYFGKRRKHLCKLTLNGCEIEWVENGPYLGIILITGAKFGCCIADKIRKFYKASKHIFRNESKSNDFMILRLVETHYIPILAYRIEVLVVSDQDTRRQLRVAYNSVFRRIFNYRQWQSVRELQSLLSRFNWEELVEYRTSKFLNRIRIDPQLNAIFPG